MWRLLLAATAALAPQVAAAVCVRSGPGGAGCRACLDACPAGALALPPGGGAPDLDPARCTGCGACLVACPTGAVGVPGWDPQPWLARAAAGSALTFACPRAAAGDAEAVPCLAGLHPELLAALALGGAAAVTLVTGPCAACPQGLGARIAGAVAAARALAAAAGAPVLPAAVPAAPPAGARRSAGLSRRSFLGVFRRRAAVAVRSTVAPGTAGPPGAGAAAPGARRALRQALAGRPLPADGPGLPLPGMRVTAACTVCGACAALCPAPGALAVTAATGGGTALVHRPAACLDCGVCASVCRAGAIARVAATPAAAWAGGDPVVLQTRREHACPHCGRPAAEPAPCPSCRQARELRGWLAAALSSGRCSVGRDTAGRVCTISDSVDFGNK